MILFGYFHSHRHISKDQTRGKVKDGTRGEIKYGTRGEVKGKTHKQLHNLLGKLSP